MNGYGSHTYSLINGENERFWVKFHLKTQQGIKNLTDQEAAAIVAEDRESSQNDLFGAIEKGDYPKWTMYFQIMTEEEALRYKENPFDLTKVWSHKDFPLIEVGELELNRNPENYFQDVEQAAFAPTNSVPGIGLSPDKMLQGRLFSYADAQRYRLGVNYHQIPVNSPKTEKNAYHRDGSMRVDGNYGARTHYAPNSYGEWDEQPEYREPSLELEGALYHYDPADEQSDDVFYQPGRLYTQMSEEQKQLLIGNTMRDIGPCTKNIKVRHTVHCYLADKDYGGCLAEALDLDMAEIETWPNWTTRSCSGQPNRTCIRADRGIDSRHFHLRDLKTPGEHRLLRVVFIRLFMG